MQQLFFRRLAKRRRSPAEPDVINAVSGTDEKHDGKLACAYIEGCDGDYEADDDDNFRKGDMPGLLIEVAGGGHGNASKSGN